MDATNRMRTQASSCQKSCRGLLLYFSGAGVPREYCIGLSSTIHGPQLDLQKLQQARQIPEGLTVDSLVIIGNAVSSPEAVPGCASGIEVVGFSRAGVTEASGRQTATPSAQGGASIAGSSQRSDAPNPLGSATPLLNGFRILTSNDSVNGRLSKAWEGLTSFDTAKFADKFGKSAEQNVNAMSKWLRDLRNAVSNPKQ